MAQIKFRVETMEELKSLTDTIDFVIDAKFGSIRQMINDINIDDCDIQLIDKVIVVAGSVNLVKIGVFSVYSTIIPLHGFEIGLDGLLKIIFDCSKIALPNGVNNIAFQLLLER